MSNKILKFWFGEDLDSLKADNYKHKPELWFKLNYDTDKLIKTEFSDLLSKAENDLLNDWLLEAHEQVALVLLLDQFSRNIYRGSIDMFKNESKSIEIASDLIKKESFDSLSLIEKYFVFIPLLNSENLENAKLSLNLIENLTAVCPKKQKTQFLKYYKQCKNQFSILEKYGRYPYKNFLLNRHTTEDEAKFLLSSKFSFVHHVQKLKPPQTKDINSLPQNIYPEQKILFLHGLRQNSNKIKKRLAFMTKILKEKCNVNVTFLNGTHAYKSENENNEIENIQNQIESQRVWFKPNDSNEVYHGIEESLQHIKINNNLHGPYDGIIGFSQGAVLASIFVKLNPNVFNYIINISAFKPRCLKYKELFSNESPFDFPSLHIYGKTDAIVTNNRSEEFSKCFKNSKNFEHPDGHFAPGSWPIDKIVEFIRSQSLNVKHVEFLKEENLDIKLDKIKNELKKFKIKDLKLENLFELKTSYEFTKSDAFVNVNITREEISKINNLNDKLIVIYLILHKAKILESNLEEKPKIITTIRIFLDTLLEYNLSYLILDSFFEMNELIILCDLSFTDLRAKDLYNHLIEKFFIQLLMDIKYVDMKQGSNLMQNLTNVKNYENIPSDISNLAFYLPRIKSSVDKRSRIGRELAIRLNPINDDIGSKILSYNHYRKCLSNICHFINELKKNFELKNPRQLFSIAKYDKKVMLSLLDSPLSDSILNPVPEPVDISSFEKMKPLYDWLNEHKKSKLTLEDIKFMRGTITTDGRLDLCKQVIGPDGIKPLLNSIENNQNIDRLLLGNNIIGDDGGRLIAEFIKSGKSPLTVWYIAGNNLTHKGIKPIAEALLNDNQVTGLWLKRNPLKAEGMVHIGNLMRQNLTINTLDLLNCGLLDEGVDILMKSIVSNKTLKHLYLSANGITINGLESIEKYWSGCLETLFLGCNRIGDKGAKILSNILKTDICLKRLNLASSRIGSDGMKYLTEGLENNSSLQLLDLGYMKASMDLGEIGNFIGDEGAVYLSKLIEKNQSLICLNITNNHITKIGMEKIIDALEKNQKIVSFDFTQYGLNINDITISEIKKKLDMNKMLLEKNHQFDIEDLLIPKHVKEIYSVYRTH